MDKEKLKSTRRGVLKTALSAGTVTGVAASSWIKPVVDAVVLPVHAQTSEVASDPEAPLTCGAIVITEIMYRQIAGDGGTPYNDEYVELRNDDSSPIDLQGWLLEDTVREGPNFQLTFTDSIVLQPGNTCRVYTHTGQYASSSATGQCMSTSGNIPIWDPVDIALSNPGVNGNYIWNNSDPGNDNLDIADEAKLYCVDDLGSPVSTCSYDDTVPNPDPGDPEICS